MRVIGGLFKGRRLTEFKGFEVRPTSDMARESLFNILSSRIYNKTFLDAFSGTGAVGIEALSRGAKSVTFNDNSLSSIKIIKENLNKIGCPQNAIVKNGDAVYLMKSSPIKYDIIFLDPPYSSTNSEEILQSACLSLEDDGIIIFEDEKPFSLQVDNLILFDKRKYGRAHFSFFKKGEV